MMYAALVCGLPVSAHLSYCLVLLVYNNHGGVRRSWLGAHAYCVIICVSKLTSPKCSGSGMLKIASGREFPSYCSREI